MAVSKGGCPERRGGATPVYHVDGQVVLRESGNFKLCSQLEVGQVSLFELLTLYHKPAGPARHPATYNGTHTHIYKHLCVT